MPVAPPKRGCCQTRRRTGAARKATLASLPSRRLLGSCARLNGFLRLQGLPLVAALGELFDQLPLEGRKIVGLAARDEPLVGPDLFVDPVAAPLADVRLETRPPGHGAAADHARPYQ